MVPEKMQVSGTGIDTPPLPDTFGYYTRTFKPQNPKTPKPRFW